MDYLVPMKNGTKHHFVSMDFHELKIDGIITPTRNVVRRMTQGPLSAEKFEAHTLHLDNIAMTKVICIANKEKIIFFSYVSICDCEKMKRLNLVSVSLDCDREERLL